MYQNSQTEGGNVDLKEEDLFELWGVDNREFIGFYHKDTKSDGYLVDDIRKINFERIPPYLSNNKSIKLWLKYPQKGITLGNYYRFFGNYHIRIKIIPMKYTLTL